MPRIRNSFEKPEFLNPGQVSKFTVDAGASSNLFLPGHRLRIELASSNFPRFDRNLNPGENPLSATCMVRALNKAYHDRERASALILLVVPK